MNYTIREREAEEAMQEAIAERAGQHQQVSVDLDGMTSELQRLAWRLKQLRRVVTGTQFDALADLLRNAHVAVETVTVRALEMKR